MQRRTDVISHDVVATSFRHVSPELGILDVCLCDKGRSKLILQCPKGNGYGAVVVGRTVNLLHAVDGIDRILDAVLAVQVERLGDHTIQLPERILSRPNGLPSMLIR